MQKILNSKNLVAFVLAAATGMALYFRVPFPEGNTFLLIMALRSPAAFEVLKYSYTHHGRPGDRAAYARTGRRSL